MRSLEWGVTGHGVTLTLLYADKNKRLRLGLARMDQNQVAKITSFFCPLRDHFGIHLHQILPDEVSLLITVSMIIIPMLSLFVAHAFKLHIGNCGHVWGG